MIVDDEALARNVLEKYISEIEALELVFQCNKYGDLPSGGLIPDIIVDIKMHDYLSGIDPDNESITSLIK